jgi:hypothetical protein
VCREIFEDVFPLREVEYVVRRWQCPGGRRQYTWCEEHARSTFELLKAMQAKNLKCVALELAKPCKTQASKGRRTRRYARRRADEQLRHTPIDPVLKTRRG